MKMPGGKPGISFVLELRIAGGVKKKRHKTRFCVELKCLLFREIKILVQVRIAIAWESQASNR
jgi:hypothetical protein